MLTGQKITLLRQKQNLTQQELAERLFVTQQSVSMWENGMRRPDRATLERLCEILRVSPEELLPEDERLLRELSECVPPGVTLGGEELSDAVNAFVRTLSEKERCIFVRRYYFAEGSKQIAGRLGLKDNQTRAILSRVRSKLRTYLSEVTA